MKVPRSLRARLLASHLIVAAAGVVTFVVIAAVAAPTFFHGHVVDMSHEGGMMSGGIVDVEGAFASALRRAFVVAVVVSAVAAAVVVPLVVGRILRPVDRIRSATRRLASGDYRERIDPPEESELAALAADVNALAASLEETERRRMQLIADVSHELRTPLTAIEGFMEGLIDGVVPAEAETFASVAEEAARLKRLAADLSTLSRIDEPSESRKERIDLGSLAQRVAERLRPQFDDQQVDLVVALPAMPMVGDPDRLTQVMVNLLGNALGHTPAGGRVVVTGSAGHGRVEVAITDTGTGIAEPDLERIFERFYRAAPSRGGGTGIGLTIARDIARSHGGDLTAHSDGPGHGAAFTLTLPGF
jgi:histidine kinase